jgi:hypothetical protein
MSDKTQEQQDTPASDDEEKVGPPLPSPIKQFEAGYSDRWSKQLLTWGVEARGLFSILNPSYFLVITGSLL